MRPLLCLAFLSGCAAATVNLHAGPDSDGDGLTNEEEALYGTDPAKPDSDGDGFTDKAEVDAGTPPLNPFIHPFAQGGYHLGNADKPLTDAAGPSQNGKYKNGDVVQNFTLLDEYGQSVDLYAFQGRYIYMTFGATWCGPCNDAADKVEAMQQQYADKLTVVEVLWQNANSGPPAASDLTDWHTKHHLDGIPVLADPTGDYLNQFDHDQGIPTMVLIGPDMTALSVDEYLEDPGPMMGDAGTGGGGTTGSGGGPNF